MIIDTKISWGHLPLLEIFAKANNLTLDFESYTYAEKTGLDSSIVVAREYTRIHYEDNSDTAVSISFMSIRHLGFENMLCDYLIRCNVSPQLIQIGKSVMKKTPEEMENEWQEHRKKIGLSGPYNRNIDFRHKIY